MRTTMRATLVVATLLALAGCNTVAGIGRDVRSAGDTIEDAAT